MRLNNSGMDIEVSPAMRDEAKIRFNLFADLLKVVEFNEWLREQFGAKPTFYVIGERKIICTPAGYALLKEAARGGA